MFSSLRRRPFVLPLAVAAWLIGATAARASHVTSADPYTGTLTGAGGGIFATDGWGSASTTLSYTVYANDADHTSWHYEYVFTVPAKNISHLIIEVSPNLTDDFAGGEVQDYTSTSNGSSNPGLPGTLHGAKFGATSLTLTVEFDLDRPPVWGDFYAKDGKDGPSHIDVIAYNTGLTDPDSDPAFDDSVLPDDFVPSADHILVPDTGGSHDPSTPEPASAVLLGLGIVAIGGYRWHRRQRAS